MKLGSGNDDLKSIAGSLCSIILTVMVCMFAYLKADVLINKKDVDIMSTINDNYYDADRNITYKEDGFNIAAAFTAFDSETEDMLDPTYGELVFMHYYWGQLEDGTNAAGRKKIDS